MLLEFKQLLFIVVPCMSVSTLKCEV